MQNRGKRDEIEFNSWAIKKLSSCDSVDLTVFPTAIYTHCNSILFSGGEPFKYCAHINSSSCQCELGFIYTDIHTCAGRKFISSSLAARFE